MLAAAAREAVQLAWALQAQVKEGAARGVQLEGVAEGSPA